VSKASFEDRLRDTISTIEGVESARIVLDENDSIVEVELRIDALNTPAEMVKRVKKVLKSELKIDLPKETINVLSVKEPVAAGAESAKDAIESKAVTPGIPETEKTENSGVKMLGKDGKRYLFDEPRQEKEKTQGTVSDDLISEDEDTFLLTERRVLLDGIDVSLGGDRTRVRVRLIAGRKEAIGLAEGSTSGTAYLRTGVRATLKAAAKISSKYRRIQSFSVSEVAVHGKAALVIGLVLESNIREDVCVGIDIVGISPQLTAVKAAVDALNKI